VQVLPVPPRVPLGSRGARRIGQTKGAVTVGELPPSPATRHRRPRI
jgi:hypothetical protein